MSEHYDKLLQKTKVKEAIKQNGYVSSETYENIKEQRNQLVRILFSLKEQAKNIQDDNNRSIHHQNTQYLVCNKLVELDIVNTSFIKEHIVSFLSYLNFSFIEEIKDSAKGYKRKEVINKIIGKLAITHSRKDSNTNNLLSIFKEERSDKAKFFYMFFDSLSSENYDLLSKLSNAELENFVDNHFHQVIYVLIDNT